MRLRIRAWLRLRRALGRGFAHAQSELGPAERAWMAVLPRRLDVELAPAGVTLAVMHGGLKALNRFVLASTPGALKAAKWSRAGRPAKAARTARRLIRPRPGRGDKQTMAMIAGASHPPAPAAQERRALAARHQRARAARRLHRLIYLLPVWQTGSASATPRWASSLQLRRHHGGPANPGLA